MDWGLAYLSSASSFLSWSPRLLVYNANSQVSLAGEAALYPKVLTRPRCRYEFYETEDKLTLSIFDKGVDPADVQIKLEPRAVSSDPDHSWPSPL